MTEAELLVIEERAKAATPGPWQPNYRSISLDEMTLAEAEAKILGDARAGLDDDWILGAEVLRLVDGRVGDLPQPTRSSFTNRDALFIAAARSDVPALIAEVRRLQGLALEAREALVPRIAKLPVTMEDLFERSRAAARIVDRMRLP